MRGAAAPTIRRGSLARSRRRTGERVIEALLAVAAFASILTTIGIVVSLVGPTVEFFRAVPFSDYLTGTTWAPLFSPARFGVLPLVTATLVVTICALIVAIPAGLGAAIYLSEYASPRLRKTLKPVLEVLAGIPTVVYGFFALTFVTPLLRHVIPGDDLPGTFNALSAGVVMGVMILPIVASLSEDAMSAVPESLRAGAFALGSTRRQVATKVVVPAALSGIVASVVLAVSRAIGETMIVTIASGSTANLTLTPLEAMQTMTAFIAQAASGDQPTGSVGYKTIFAVASTLFVVTFLLNIVSTRLVRRFREVYE